MTSEWVPVETGKHQDHVIAHVLGTTVLGYFEFNQAAHLLLDIGFIWTIFADGEMGLLTQSLAIDELELDPSAKAELLADVQLLHDGDDPGTLTRISPAPADCLVEEVGFSAHSYRRRIVIRAETACLVVESSLETGEIQIKGTFTDSPSH